MIYTVTFNPSLDYIVSVDNFEVGSVNRTKNELIYPGGKGINVSTVLNNLRCQNCAIGFFSGFTGETIISLLKQNGIDIYPIWAEKGISRINIKLRSLNDSKETEINAQGPQISVKSIETLYRKLDVMNTDDILVLSGSVPYNLPDTIYADIMEYIKNKNVKVAVDAEKGLLMNTLKYRPFLIKPNISELRAMFNAEICNREGIVKYANILRKMGALNVLVSLGEKGAVLAAGDGNIYIADAPRGKAVNTVGSGDSMVAGFIFGLLENEEYAHALKMAVCTGSASAFSPHLATHSDVLKLDRLVNVDTL